MKALSILLALAVYGNSLCFADVLQSKRFSTIAIVKAFDRSSIQYTEGCSKSDLKSIFWSDVQSITFEKHCGTGLEKQKDAPPDCKTDSLDVFVLEFSGSKTEVIAESIAYGQNGLFHLDLFEPWEQAHGPISVVHSIRRAGICRDKIPKIVDLPKAYCRESRQVAVAFDYGNPMSNRILTNGFSFFLKVSGISPKGFDIDIFGEEVKRAFQGAISLWTSSMAERDNLLTPNLRKFLKSRTSVSPGGYSVLIPPQVVRLDCPQGATFIVELVFNDPKFFPAFPFALARAAIEGRTLALNFRKPIKCYRSELKFDEHKRLRFGLDDGCVNLLPIMTHELGHAFGIHHLNLDGSVSLMDDRLSNDALAPTDRDIVALVDILNRSVEGSAPGVLNFVSSSGVRPPTNWHPELLNR